jgi:hypothetical protein
MEQEIEPRVCCVAQVNQILTFCMDGSEHPEEITCALCGAVGKLVETQEDISWKMGAPEGSMVITTTKYVWTRAQSKRDVVM